MKGLKLQAIYSYSPSRLGFCGRSFKNTHKILENYITGKNKDEENIKKVLVSFEAAFPYLKLIATSNKIKDPFDKKVVEALWLGNILLDNIKLQDVKQMVLNDFVKPGLLSRKQALKRISKLKAPVYLHHGFHVLVFGPVTGIRFGEKIYDLCRICYGKVKRFIKLKGLKVNRNEKKILVKYRPLIYSNNKFILSSEIEKEIEWNEKFVSNLRIGDTVTFHWNRVCQVINKKQQKNLLKYTKINLNLLNFKKNEA